MYQNSLTILVADDDPDDRLFALEALEEAGLKNKIEFVEDGEELMDYLLRRGSYASEDALTYPGFILLDLNMPRKDGREALKEIKSDPKLRQIPVIVLTTSNAQEDIMQTYDLGVSSYITKPPSFQDLVETMKALSAYWLETVRLPVTA